MTTDGRSNLTPMARIDSLAKPHALLLGLSLSAVCALAGAQTDDSTSASDKGAAVANPDQWPSPDWPISRNEAREERIAYLLGRMTAPEKIGQILQGDISTVTPADVREYHLGSVLSGGNSGPYGDDKAPKEQWLKLADEYYAASMDTSDGAAAIPIVWGTDAVHGHSNIIGATIFPHNIGLGAMHDDEIIQRIGEATALEIRATGQEWTFAPTVTVPQDYRWGRAYEGYSSDPELVSSYVGRMITGLQGDPRDEPILDGPGVIASTKHFLADGGTDNGTDQGDASISEKELRDIHGAPYTPAIETGVGTVMASFSSWNGVKMTGNKSLLTGVLKEQMNFDGFTVSDWNAHGQIQGCTNESCPEALLAGIDMYMAPDSWKDLYKSLLKQVESGEIPMKRLDSAVASILRVKLRLGLFEAGKPSDRPHSGDWSLIGAPEHRAVAREAVRKSLVLLKNESGLLPLKPGTQLLVAGEGADDVARQSGGWTITWQGTGVSPEDFPGATSLYQGLTDAVTATGGKVELKPAGDYSDKPDAAVVVFGETPYAEFQGDLDSLQLSPALRQPYETMKKLQAEGIPVIAVMITGRPLFMNPELNVADDFVVAWLPGSEGAGLADVLVADENGKARHDFTGTLPAAWPGSAEQGDDLYPVGHGLTLESPQGNWKKLDEDAGAAMSSQSVWFDRGVPTASWSLQVGNGKKSTTRITTVPTEAMNGKVTVSATDFGVQEGARSFEVAKDTMARVELVTSSAVDIAAISGEADHLTFSMRLDKPPASALTVAMGSAKPDAKGVALSAPADGAGEDWQTYSVPLECFSDQGVDMKNVNAPFRLDMKGPATVSLSRVALGKKADTVTVDCK